MQMRVVVGIGDKEFGAPLQWAIDEFYFAGAILLLIHCIEGRLPTEMPYSNDEEFTKGQLIIDEAIEFATDYGATVASEVREGFAGEILVEASIDAGLLVIGSSQKRKLLRAPGQSVVTYCVRHSQCPLTIVSGVNADHIGPRRG